MQCFNRYSIEHSEHELENRIYNTHYNVWGNVCVRVIFAIIYIYILYLLFVRNNKDFRNKNFLYFF